MSLADRYFKETCRRILTSGTSTEGQKVRPHWEDGTPAYTIKTFCEVHRYDLRKEFPAITLRNIYLKSALDEVLWIWQKKSNRIADLKSKVWNEWADKAGTIGKAYGYQVGKKFCFKRCDISKPYSLEHWVQTEKKRTEGLPSAEFRVNELWLDQMDAILYQLKNEPFSRRIIGTTWNVDELADMNLQPCAYSMTFNVTEENGKLVLNAILNQRSQDMLAANGWNVAQYAMLHMLIAESVDMIAGEFVHVIADCHIYDRHIPMIQELMERAEYPAPKVSLKHHDSFYDYSTEDLVVEDYQYGEQIKDIPIAI